MDPTRTPSWQALAAHQTTLTATRIDTLLAQNPDRAQQYALSVAGLHVDFSRHRATDETLRLLQGLARDSDFRTQRDALFSGAALNLTENRPALHTLLRQPDDAAPLSVQGKNLSAEVRQTRQRMRDLVQQVHTGTRRGYTGKPLTGIVNIGIGGSHLGPKVVGDALRPYWRDGMTLDYIANIDGHDIDSVCRRLDPETTLFVVSSKSFNTLETLKNAEAARRWFLDQGASQAAIATHFIAVSTNIEKATDFGIAEDNIFPLWDWVGGRYSLWSAIGLPQALVLGMDRFEELLAGAHAMDEHFRLAAPEQNLPLILGLLGIWYQNFWGAQTQAVLVYDESLRDFPNHLQQLDMESNGKGVTRAGKTADWATGAVVWGGTGTNGQHAYHQLLHQGTRLIPADFIMPLHSHYPVADHHDWLFANFVGQQQALLEGRSEAQILHELQQSGMKEAEARALAPHKVIPGNQPHTSITMERITPETLGALIALYEHRVFAQSTIWGINAFDQWGVELGKQLGDAVYASLQSGDLSRYDASTAALIRRYRATLGQGG